MGGDGNTRQSNTFELDSKTSSIYQQKTGNSLVNNNTCFPRASVLCSYTQTSLTCSNHFSPGNIAYQNVTWKRFCDVGSKLKLWGLRVTLINFHRMSTGPRRDNQLCESRQLHTTPEAQASSRLSTIYSIEQCKASNNDRRIYDSWHETKHKHEYYKHDY